MKTLLLSITFSLLTIANTFSQDSFNYRVELEPITIPGLIGVHSYAYAQSNGKWLIIGGRLDGVHARQPFNAFPENQNNTDVFVIDVNTQEIWSSSVNVLSTGIQEQLQSTNMNFYQNADTLYFIGGYAFSQTAQDHITFPSITTIEVSSVIQAVINNNDITPYFKQAENQNFAISGGQMGKLDGKLMIVGGHRFDGRYNPMGNPTYVQTYTNSIRSFEVDNSGIEPTISNYSEVIDPVHLHRRDYNLLPQIYPDGTHGYMISSGVFQPTVDLPFLYPVDITSNGYTPNTSFNQYLCNYHGAKVAIHDEDNNQMHNLFFGGISQYYYENGTLIQDDEVPFVKTISKVSRYSDSSLIETKLDAEMPALKGAGAEFILNEDLPHHNSKVIKLNESHSDTILIGHILGGILSPSLNPFSNNETNTTSADASIYAVKLIYDESLKTAEIDGKNPNELKVYPNPTKNKINVELSIESANKVEYFLTGSQGNIIDQGEFNNPQSGINKFKIKLDPTLEPQTILLTVIVDNVYFLTKKVIKQ